MATRNNSADFEPLVSRSEANTAFRDALRLFVGRNRRYSCKQIEIGTGIKARMIESFMAPIDSTEFRKPDLEEVLTLSRFLGAEFTTELLAPAGQGAFELPQDIDPPPGAIVADTAEDSFEVARAGRDGVFCATDRQHLRPVGLRMMRRGAELVAMAKVA